MNSWIVTKTNKRLDENNTVKNPNTCLRSNKESYSNQLEKSEANVENTIFVGNLPNSIELKELKKMFRKFGVVINARLRGAVRKELKIPKRLSVIKKEFHDDSEHINAYIKFSSIDSCKAALKMNGEMYQSRHLRVSLASDSGKADPRKSVFLGNLPFKVQDDHIWEVFEDCGAVENIRLIRDEKTGVGKGFGYVNFKSADSVELALQLNGVNILDRNIRISRDDRNMLRKTKTNVKKIVNETKPMIEKRPIRPEITKNYFQGQKTKRSIHKKFKKKKKLDKKMTAIKQIAESMEKKN